MKYLFEDHEKSAISRLFRAVYPDSISENFRYSRGNANLEDKALEIIDELGNPDELVFVLVDSPPDNDEAHYVYSNLCRLYQKQPRIIPLPIICSEYYLLKALWRNYDWAITNKEIVAVAVDMLKWGAPGVRDRVMADTSSWGKAERCYNFERYCKLAIRLGTLPCVSKMQDFYCKDCGVGCRRTYEVQRMYQ